MAMMMMMIMIFEHIQMFRDNLPKSAIRQTK